MIKALIVEDELIARKRLSRMLNESFSDIETVGETTSVMETVGWLKSNPAPDLIFMDVELSDGNCFEIFSRVEVSSYVVMTTAYDSYAVKAFEAGSVDYLLKPISLPALERAVGRIRERLREASNPQRLLEVLSSAGLLPGKQAQERYKSRSTVRSGDKIIPLEASEIALFYAEDKSNFLMTLTGERHIIDSTIETLASELDPELFFRISRSCIISRKAIESVVRKGDGKLVVTSSPVAPIELSVSRGKISEFLSWLE